MGNLHKGGRLAGVLAAVLAIVLSVSGACAAQETVFDLYGVVQTLGSQRESGAGYLFKLDDTILFGVGFGYSPNYFLNINTELKFGSADFDDTVYGGWGWIRVWGSQEVLAWDVNLDWNIIEYPITPMITAGVGFMTWGYMDPGFSYNYGAGFRWAVTERVLVKGTYRFLTDTANDLDFDGFSVGVGVTF